MSRILIIVLLVTFFLTIIVGGSALMGYLTYLLWGAVAVPMGAPELSFWMAWALWVVLSTLFGLMRSSTSSK